MFTEEQLLQLLKVQSNLYPKDFIELFGEDRGQHLFQIFARESWNLVSFLFNKVNGADREKLLRFINLKVEKDYIPKDPGTKLKVAAEDVKDICRKYDIAGAYVLHTPGHGEFVLHLNPTYSSVYMYDDSELRFYSKRKDFNSDEEQLQKQADTCNMLRLLTDMTANNFMMLKKLADKADSLTGAIHNKG